jgi:mannose/fructose-specific phosphotransferase system component IIA
MKVIFDKEQIQPEIPGIILMSHGPLATAIVESATLIIGEQPNLAAFGLETTDTLEDYAVSVVEAYQAFGGNALVLVDLYGGTPCNQLVLAALRNQMKLYAVSGLNLPMVMEACGLRMGASGAQLVEQVVEISQAGIINISAKLEQQKM